MLVLVLLLVLVLVLVLSSKTALACHRSILRFCDSAILQFCARQLSGPDAEAYLGC